MKPREVDSNDAVVAQAAVGPALTSTNAVGRFVLVPATEFSGVEGVGGWVGKIKSVERRSPHITTVTLNDGQQRWKLDYVISAFKTIS